MSHSVSSETWLCIVKEMYKLDKLDKAHREAYDKITGLLQVFMDRQRQIRELKKQCKTGGEQGKYQQEQILNSQIIKWIQWIRYHLWGNDDATINIKCKEVSWKTNIGPGGILYGGIMVLNNFWYVNDWIINTLNIPEDKINIVPYDKSRQVKEKDVVLLLIESIREKKHSIFDMLDDDNGSVTLEYEINRMLSKIEPIY